MPPSPVQSVWITVSVVSGLQNNTCLQPWDLSSSSSSSPLLPRCSLSSLASSPSSSSSPSPPLTAVHVHLAHDTGDSQDIPPLSTKGVLQPSVYSRIHWAGFQSLTDPFLCVLLQIFTLPTALTSFHKASLFTWVPSFSWRGGGTSFPLFYLDILGLKIINLSAVFSLSSLFLFSSHAPSPSASVAEYHSSDQLGFKMLFSPSPPLNPPPTVPFHLGLVHWHTTQQGRQEALSAKTEAASFYSTKWVALWLENGMSLSGSSSTLKQKEGVRKQTQEEEEEELNCWGSTFYSPERG